MKEDIISQKIRRELSHLPIDTEPRVMYLLVEMRKVHEHENNPDEDGTLRFYADWVVHTRLNRAFAQEVFDMVSGDNGVENAQIVAFYKLKSALKAFLERHDLPTNLVDTDSWIPFRERLIDILVDTPVEKVEGKKVVGSFTFQRRGASGIEYHLIGKGGESLSRLPLE